MWHIILTVACCAIIKLLFDQILKVSKEEQYEKEAKKKEKKQAAYEEEKKLGRRADEAAYYLRELFKDSEKVTDIQRKNVQWWEDQKTYKYQDSEITVTKEPLKATLKTGEVVLEIKDGLPTIKSDAPWIEYVKRRALEIKEKSEKRKAGDNLKKHIENQASLDVRLQEAKAEVPEFERKERERKQAAAKAKQKPSEAEIARKKAKEEAKKKAVEAARKARTAPKKP